MFKGVASLKKVKRLKRCAYVNNIKTFETCETSLDNQAIKQSIKYLLIQAIKQFQYCSFSLGKSPLFTSLMYWRTEWLMSSPMAP